MGSQHQVMKRDNLWSYNKVSHTVEKLKYSITAGEKNGQKSHPLGTVGLYGRAFDRDPPFAQVGLGLD